MSKQALVEFMQTAATDESVLAEILQTTGASDFVALAKRKGFELGDLTADEIQRMLASIMGLGATQELTDEELDMVSAAGLSKLQEAGASLKPGGDRSAILIQSDAKAENKTPFILEVTSWMTKS
jgi:predicted ribosomally synthesized peptide with nif11-like leader